MALDSDTRWFQSYQWILMIKKKFNFLGIIFYLKKYASHFLICVLRLDKATLEIKWYDFQRVIFRRLVENRRSLTSVFVWPLQESFIWDRYIFENQKAECYLLESRFFFKLFLKTYFQMFVWFFDSGAFIRNKAKCNCVYVNCNRNHSPYPRVVKNILLSSTP